MIDRALQDVYEEAAEVLCSIDLIKTTFIEVGSLFTLARMGEGKGSRVVFRK